MVAAGSNKWLIRRHRGYYLVLSKPRYPQVPNYKGLYRRGPFPCSNEKDRFFSLWQRYVKYLEKTPGVTTELSVGELQEFAKLATQQAGEQFEVVYFSQSCKCQHEAEYYGIDVASDGGYSMVGENIFPNAKSHLYGLINQYFRTRLNSNGLFDTVGDAVLLKGVLSDLNTLSPGCVEQEDWRIIYVFRVL